MNQLAEVHDTQLQAPVELNGVNPLVAAALNADIDPDKLDKLLALQERYEANEAEKAFNVSMTKARGAFKVAKQSGYNSHLENNYSKLVDLDEAVREALAQNGLSYRFVPSIPEKGTIKIQCTISHELGHAEHGAIEHDANANKNNAVNSLQSTKSVSTYLKGMLLSSMLGIMSGDEADDDGEGAENTAPSENLINRIVQILKDNDAFAFYNYLEAVSPDLQIKIINDLPEKSKNKKIYRDLEVAAANLPHEYAKEIEDEAMKGDLMSVAQLLEEIKPHKALHDEVYSLLSDNCKAEIKQTIQE